ncbi:MAG: Dyp-type peroxidase [Flavitalea sp.]
MKTSSVQYKESEKWVQELNPSSTRAVEKNSGGKLDIQGLITRGYKSLNAASYLLLKITEPNKAKEYFNSLLPYITRGEQIGKVDSPSKGDPQTAVNIAFTSGGLEILGLPDDIMDTFSREFLEGMTYVDLSKSKDSLQERSILLGDMENNSPAKWHWGNNDQKKSVDCVIMLFARGKENLEELEDEMFTKKNKGVTVVHKADTYEYDTSNIREHFGFRDGISQPVIKGISKTKSDAELEKENFINPGEFILGYENEYQNYSPSPYIDKSKDNIGLPPLQNDDTKRDLGKNGTYMVFRQIEQHVEKFWEYMYLYSKESAVSKTEKAIKLAAKMVGRWPDGQPLVTCPDGNGTMEPEELNNFDYAAMDKEGLRCPFGAHIRRTNPRDQMHSGRNEKASAELSNKHRMLRRGRNYGEPLDKDFNVENMIRMVVDKIKDKPAEDPDCNPQVKETNDSQKIKIVRGLHFICMVSDISRQFEFVQNVWANTSTFGALCNEVDPIISPRPTPLQPHCLEFSTPQPIVRNRYQKVPEFTTVVGGAYFFMPGLKALKFILQ